MFPFRKREDSKPESVKPAIALIAEDEPILRMNAAEMLQDMGFAIEGAETADQALTLLNTENVELLITDIHMPGARDGLMLAREAVERWPSLHVVICSGRTHLTDAQLPPRTKFVAKPYTMDDIEDAILSF